MTTPGEARQHGWNAWPLRHVVSNPFTDPKLRDAWERGREERRVYEGGRHKSNAGDFDKTIERLSAKGKYD